MKILLVSMNSIHFRRWSDQLRDRGHEVYWFDILDQGYAPSMSWMTQITGWKKGFLKKRGRTFLKNKLPKLFNALVHKYDTSVTTAFEKSIQEIQPDLVHSFALYTACLPILDAMQEHKAVKWMYSSWGSDLFYRANKPNYENEVTRVLARVNYLITDCERDAIIACKMGYNGVHKGIFPGGGGFIQKEVTLDRNKNTFILKGYENELGKAIPVLKAFQLVAKEQEIQLIVFGATKSLLDFIKANDLTNMSIDVHQEISHAQVLALMESSRFYIGNSISDGIPNSMLEAIFMGCIPIQSNPGNATAEIIKHEFNGFLIQNPLDFLHIRDVILKAIHLQQSYRVFYENNASIRAQFDRVLIQNEVLDIYKNIAL
ncbi:glycosyl transferase family 1 [Nonlabens arenilitoris]|uniref:Glycosyl transferase family 1 n=1 Tax=Nonlabens arenilitoris TaxID=1217969 RepID=A0A2S7UB90_9FLAO|nr:glycosyltransferase [Nonlabens arenilitoris]PQJ32186.1 glycosyl transferase family 1 [Nonlabens arenilitoris]